ncbi:hypothetical protein GGR58DRAFT_528105 [Xylaria digitata]|nr:hypothetical protein GGR58DRAFT_528105 [Xylaria digitata]
MIPFWLLSVCPIIRDGSHVKRWIHSVELLEQAVSDDFLATHESRAEHLHKRVRKSRSTSPIESRNDLRRLAKPIYVNHFESPSILPPDVRSLHSEIWNNTQFYLRIIPKELRQQLSTLEGQGSIPEHSFCTTDATDDVDSMLSVIWNIKHKAAISTELERHEQTWNHFVHTPLLELAFGSEAHPFPTEQVQDVAAVRLEPVMTAVIARDSIPWLNPRPFSTSNDTGSVLACSVPDSNTEQCTDHASMVSERSESKKVGHVLVSDLAETVPLQSIISGLAQQVSIYDEGPAHVNQTTYPPVCNNLIAVSIETKTISSEGSRSTARYSGCRLAQMNGQSPLLDANDAGLNC